MFCLAELDCCWFRVLIHTGKTATTQNNPAMLKRKNEESEGSKGNEHTSKRVALDAEAVKLKDIQDDKQHTSVPLNEIEQDNENKMDTVNESEDDAELEVNDVEVVDDNGTPGNEFQEIDASSDVSKSDSTTPSSIPSKQDFVNGPISSHKVVQNDDPTYVHFRMLASISDTASIVGKGGDTISKIKEESTSRVNVSENLKGIPERVISVRGSAEFVAKALGLIVRAINNEPFNQSSNADSKFFTLRLLFPHSIMGYIIGKKGSRFREIEENSAASLNANDQILPASTDRILNITGVADAIHIATYYVAQTVIEHKQQMTKVIYYNPANYNQPSIPAVTNKISNNANGQAQFNNYNNMGMISGMVNPQMNQMGQIGQMGQMNQMGQMGQMGQMNQMNQMNQMGQPMNQMNQMNQMGQPMNQMNYGMQNQMQFTLSSPAASLNTKPGETSTQSDGKVGQDLYVPQNHIGLVIGRGGKNLKDIRLNTGCYVKVNDEVPGAADRKLTLIGNLYGIQNAIVLINNKIENEKQRKNRDAN